MNEKTYFQYHTAYLKAVYVLSELYNQHKMDDEVVLRNLLFSEYRQRGLDPDGKAQRYEFDIKCTADGLHSIWRICNLEKNVEDIVSTYERYRRIPIFFFPSDIGGINTSRAKTFGDRIDHTLFDLKMYYSEERDKCRLLSAYNRPKTKAWLKGMKSFENIVDWWGVKGIFTDENYNVYDLEFEEKHIISGLRGVAEYQAQWSIDYYNNLKKRIDLYMNITIDSRRK